MDALKELAKKKGKDKGPMDPKDKAAKMSVLKQISDMAGKVMGNDIRGLKKVTVASPDQEGLEMGLDKAKDMVSKHDEPMDDDSMDDADDMSADMDDADDSDDGDENPSVLSEHGGGHDGKAAQLIEDQIDEETEEGDLTPEEIDALIRDLEMKREQLSKK